MWGVWGSCGFGVAIAAGSSCILCRTVSIAAVTAALGVPRPVGRR